MPIRGEWQLKPYGFFIPQNMAVLSIYQNVKDTKSADTILLNIFLDAVQTGKWEDQVLKIRTIKDKEQRRIAKSTLPNVTISGIFTTRTDKDCKLHSGYIAMDLDNLNEEVEGTKELLKDDPYIYAMFTSVSGTGLCVLFKIDSEKHKESFEGLAEYLIKNYQLIVDPTGINPSRTRFVSYDPHIIIKDKCLKFKKYLPKVKPKKTVTPIFVKTEFDEVIKQMIQLEVSCVNDYRDWRDISFALADQFGKDGYHYFKSLSELSDKYDEDACIRQYDHAVKRLDRKGKKITISTIYYFAKQAGINIYSETTAKVAAVTSSSKKAGLDQSAIKDNLEKFEGITGVDDIIAQAFEGNTDFVPGESLVNNIRMWIRHNYKLRRNVITRKIENGVQLDDTAINSMYLDAKVIFKELNFELFSRVIFSNNTPNYNPLKIFIESGEWDGHCRIEQLAKCINSNTGSLEWREKMLTKWLVGIIHAIYGGKNELNFIFVGAKNTGKTEFFRRILPECLKNYFAESQLNRGKDDEILMGEKLVIFNDEYGGKNRTDERNEKRLMASSEFDLREPYGKANITVKRLATLCGTCNERDVLDDPTGNRRIIIMEASGKFDYELYNEINKEQLLFEARSLWLDGERPLLDDDDIIELEATTDGEYSRVSFEQEMIQKYMLSFEDTRSNPWDFMTTTEIKLHLESHTKEKINLNKLGARLRKLGYPRVVKDKVYGYQIATVPPIVVTFNK